MFLICTILVMLVQAVLNEFMGEPALLVRLWILPIVVLAFDTKKVQLLPIVAIGLLVDGLYAAPTGFHVLELGLVYACLSFSIEHLGHRTIISRIVLGVLVSLLNLFIHVVLAHCLSVTAQADYLLNNLFELVLTQGLLIGVCLPIFQKLLATTGSTEYRLNVDGGNP